MIYNLKTEESVECYYREVDIVEAGEYVPPRWLFDFKEEFNDGYKVFVLETLEYPGVAQGVVAIGINKAEVSVHLKSTESSADNKTFIRGQKRNGINKDRIYTGVGANLVAFACQYSLENECEGFMYLISKTETVSFYEDLGGISFGHRVVFNEFAGRRLADRYFPGGEIQWLK
ncbi:hypothetical protein JDS99_04660 [Bacillus cereus group sp. N6]|uniref:hypothetical protein n=1 Tax=Bacillus cereus group sp. N6 TaxID=2794583 RepID=UPI0018F49951|nr:hypothetical protein [Bacillus cereus group sp. N6]MBJ8108955.1 hypothetical protein [Bacillus cereus group sp. N6]